MSLIIPMFLQKFCRHFPLNDVIILLYHITTCFQTVGDSLPQSEHMTQISKRKIVHVQGSTYNWLGNPSNLPYFPMRNMAVNPFMAEVRVHPPARDWQNAYSYGARCRLSGLLHM